MMHVSYRHHPLRRSLAILAALAVTLALLPALPGVARAATSDLLFTQYIEGSGFNKALEVGNTTGQTVDLGAGNYYVVGYHNGNTTTQYEIPLTGSLADGDAWVLAEGNSATDDALTSVADVTRGGLWNGDDALVLYRDYDAANDQGTVLDSIGQIGVQKDWGTAPTRTINTTLCPIEGRVTGDTAPFDAYDPADDWIGFPSNTFFGIGDPTLCGEDPDSAPFVPCTTITPIHEINTVGANGLPNTSKFGEELSVEAVVTANFIDGLGGVFVQEQDANADDDPTTSEGIYVDLRGTDADALSVGDLVCATGTVGNFQGTYQLTNFAEFEVLEQGVDLPTAFELEMPVEDRTELAQLAGMRVDLTSENGAMTVTQNFFMGRFGELDLSANGFQWHPTELFPPGSEDATQLREDNLNAQIKLDDANSTQNPTPTPWVANGDVRAGAEITSTIEGIVHYQFSAFRVQPTAAADVELVNTANPRPEGAPDVLAGADDNAVTATVAAFNVLNYFTTLTSESRDARGADTIEEFELQAAKIVTAIIEMDADVVGLIEIENNFGGPDDALLDLVDRLNTATAPATYAAIELKEPVGTDAISNAMIYQPERVTPVGDVGIADQAAFVNPLGADRDRNRPAIAQAFEVETGDIFVAVVNHLKSKGSGCGSDDPGDPIVGSCNLTRTAAAAEMVRWLAEDDPTATGSDSVAIIGDLNAYAMEDPLEVIKDGGYLDPFSDDLPVYSYTFDGEHGRLDHALLSPSLNEALVGAAIWHINTDEPAAFGYSAFNNAEDQDTSEFRSSDHDPVIVGLQFAPDEPQPTTPTGTDECRDGGWESFTEPGFRNQGQCIAFVASGQLRGGGQARGPR